MAKEFGNIAKLIQNATETRNNIIHGLWAFSEKSPEPYSVIYKGKNRVLGKAYNYAEADIRKFIAEIVALGDKLAQLSEQHL